MKKIIAILTLATIAIAPMSLVAGDQKCDKDSKAPCTEKGKKECPASKKKGGCNKGSKKQCPASKGDKTS